VVFREALRELGLIDGRNVRIDLRWGAGDAEITRKAAAELIALTPDVIVASSGSVLGHLLKATRSVPIVFVVVPDPVGSGFVHSLTVHRPRARLDAQPPRGNVRLHRAARRSKRTASQGHSPEFAARIPFAGRNVNNFGRKPASGTFARAHPEAVAVALDGSPATARLISPIHVMECLATECLLWAKKQTSHESQLLTQLRHWA
jgi:hypothetical protein